MNDSGQTIIRSGTKPSIKGPDTWFTGSVRIDNMFQAAAPGRATGAIVDEQYLSGALVTE